MSDTSITLRGRIGTDLRTYKTSTGRLIVRFRLAVTKWRVTDAGEIVEDHTNWFTVRAWDRLAQNIMRSVQKGQPVIVVGRPAASGWLEEKDGQKEIRTDLIINAQSIGHDLSKGIAGFEKPVLPAPANGDSAVADEEARDAAIEPQTGGGTAENAQPDFAATTDSAPGDDEAGDDDAAPDADRLVGAGAASVFDY